MPSDLNIRTMAMGETIKRIIATVPAEEWAAIAELPEAEQTAAIERVIERAEEG